MQDGVRRLERSIQTCIRGREGPAGTERVLRFELERVQERRDARAYRRHVRRVGALLTLMPVFGGEVDRIGVHLVTARRQGGGSAAVSATTPCIAVAAPPLPTESMNFSPEHA